MVKVMDHEDVYQTFLEMSGYSSVTINNHENSSQYLGNRVDENNSNNDCITSDEDFIQTPSVEQLDFIPTENTELTRYNTFQIPNNSNNNYYEEFTQTSSINQPEFIPIENTELTLYDNTFQIPNYNSINNSEEDFVQTASIVQPEFIPAENTDGQLSHYFSTFRTCENFEMCINRCHNLSDASHQNTNFQDRPNSSKNLSSSDTIAHVQETIDFGNFDAMNNQSASQSIINPVTGKKASIEGESLLGSCINTNATTQHLPVQKLVALPTAVISATNPNDDVIDQPPDILNKRSSKFNVNAASTSGRRLTKHSSNMYLSSKRSHQMLESRDQNDEPPRYKLQVQLSKREENGRKIIKSSFNLYYNKNDERGVDKKTKIFFKDIQNTFLNDPRSKIISMPRWPFNEIDSSSDDE